MQGDKSQNAPIMVSTHRMLATYLFKKAKIKKDSYLFAGQIAGTMMNRQIGRSS